MSLTVKIIVSLVIAAAIASVTTLLQGNPLPDLPMLLACCLAAFAAALVAARPAPAAGDRPAAAPKRSQAAPSPVIDDDAERQYGSVKWFNTSKGFGFIIKDDGEEIFVHFRSIRGEGRRGLKDGQRVSFVVVDSDKGPQAEDVTGEA